jgi:hypothetical protein
MAPGAGQPTSRAWRPLYQPQLRHTVCGTLTCRQLGHTLRAGALSNQALARRLRDLDFEVFFLGTATGQLCYRALPPAVTTSAWPSAKPYGLVRLSWSRAGHRALPSASRQRSVGKRRARRCGRPHSLGISQGSRPGIAARPAGQQRGSRTPFPLGPAGPLPTRRCRRPHHRHA